MASLPNTKLLSYEEWLETPEVKDEEVVDGEIRIMAAAKVNHALIVSHTQLALVTQLDPSKFYVFTGSFGIVIRVAPLTCRTPDLAVFERSNFVEVDGYIRSAPDLAIEVLSPRNTPKDMRRKIADYGELGLPELWIFSQDERTVEILLLEEGRLRRSALLSEGWLKPTRIPQVEIEIPSIWPA
jgi:Uma2 family endonuclease